MKGTTRKDRKGYALKTGELERPDGRYEYRFSNKYGERKSIYADSLRELRVKEKKLQRDLDDGLDPLKAKKLTVNDVFDVYMKTKRALRDTTRNNYIYTYDTFVRNRLGRMKIGDVRKSDIIIFYNELLDEGLKANTVDNIQTLLHPTFRLAVDDELIRMNPASSVMGEIKKNESFKPKKRVALTIPQQKALLEYIKNHPRYYGWYPLIVTFLGTGMRSGELFALRWEDIDYEKNVIHVNHTVTYKPNAERKSEFRVNDYTKTEAGTRDIPLISEVKEALAEERALQDATGVHCIDQIDGYSGFVFCSAYGHIRILTESNRAYVRIVRDYNKMETERAAEEGREPLLLPHFSNHCLRHTFATRLCENESNLKVIQTVMGHEDIETTMNIYADCTKEKQQETLQSLEGKIIIK